MPMTLYYAPGACSFVPHVLLEATGEPFDRVMVKIHKGEQQNPEYLAINPHGQVPVLVDDGAVITQIIAIVTYLNDRFPDAGFLPKEPLAKAKALELLAWMNNTVHPTFTHIFMPEKFTDNSELHADLKAYNTRLYGRWLDELQALVDAATKRDGEWLTGAAFGPLDAYTLTLARWGTLAGIDPAHRPALWSFVNKVAAHPPVATVLEREKVPLNLYRPA